MGSGDTGHENLAEAQYDPKRKLNYELRRLTMKTRAFPPASIPALPNRAIKAALMDPAIAPLPVHHREGPRVNTVKTRVSTFLLTKPPSPTPCRGKVATLSRNDVCRISHSVNQTRHKHLANCADGADGHRVCYCIGCSVPLQAPFAWPPTSTPLCAAFADARAAG